MTVISKKTILYFFLILILGILTYLFMFYLSVIDISNVKLEGYVFDEETKKPISGVLVIINNDRYEDNKGNKNYDEYLGHDIIKLYSDEKGYYSTNIDKSAFIWIEFSKKEYFNQNENGKHSSKLMNYKTYLKKKNRL